MPRVMFSLTVDSEVKEEGDMYVSYCPALDVYSQGDSEDEASANLIEALQLFLQSCYERGTLDAVMKERGFTVERDAPATVQVLPGGDSRQSITLPVAVRA